MNDIFVQKISTNSIFVVSDYSAKNKKWKGMNQDPLMWSFIFIYSEYKNTIPEAPIIF